MMLMTSRDSADQKAWHYCQLGTGLSVILVNQLVSGALLPTNTLSEHGAE